MAASQRRKAEPRRRRPISANPWLVGLALWVTIGPQLLAHGPNLLANPTFDSGLEAWSPDGGSTSSGSASWAPSDSDGSIDSGSAKLTSTSNGIYGLGQCISVVGSTSYVWGARAWIPSSNPTTGVAATVYVEWFNTQNCGGGISDLTLISFHARGKWENQAGTMVAPLYALSARFGLNKEFSSPLVYFDNAFFGAGTCAPSSTRLCLNQGRFQVDVTWTTRDQATGPGMAVPFAADSGSFWFFSPTNIELDIKVLDACVPSLGNHYWVFAAGLTDVHVVLTVTDTKTGDVRTYTNLQGRGFQPINDTKAFTTCP